MTFVLCFPDAHIADGYRWSSVNGYRGYPKHNSEKTLVLRKTKKILTEASPYYGDNRFCLYLYKLAVDNSTCLMAHYLGDCSIFKDLPFQRQSCNPKKPWFSTAKKVLSEIRAQPDARPQALYEELQCQPEASAQPAYCPRNLKQVSPGY